MKLTILAVGRLRDDNCRALCADYIRRTRRFSPIEMVEVKEGRGLPPKQAIAAEGVRLLEKLPRGCHAVALDEHGKSMTSVGLAGWLTRRQQDATRDLRFVIGGAYGLSADVKARCDLSLRLSDMTLPHQLARVLAAEQLYRAWTILRREPYHHV